MVHHYTNSLLVMSASPSCNPSTPEALLRSPAMTPGVVLHRRADRSLNARFLPRGAIRTRAVAVCDDDVALPSRALSFALALFRSRSRSGPAPPLVGFFGRAHDLDPARREWVYGARGDRYSILLAMFLLLPAPLLRRYSCTLELAPARRVVELAPARRSSPAEPPSSLSRAVGRWWERVTRMEWAPYVPHVRRGKG
uniref:Glycosyl transferase 64 domain-containing protein n=1 Tax=Ananas comosus var. bracteatus TaxID=296719 RepID=A0A6V7Q5T7_ANACO|nr:unnamed protein product [Ananas comosus var. bracteatus]